MGNTQERKKQRRRYLWKKGKAYTKFSIATLLAIPCTLIGCLLLAAFAMTLYDYFILNNSNGAKSPINFVSWIGTILLFGAMIWVMVRAARRAHQAAKQLPYVPPVTADTLPAEEVLVRGSVEPTQEQGKVLLRGTGSSTDTEVQELLRGSQGQ